MNILFWNIQRKDLKPEITKLCDIYLADLFFIAEVIENETVLLDRINEYARKNYAVLPKNDKNITCLIDNNLKYKRLATPFRQIYPIEVEFENEKILFIGVHFDSKLHKNTNSQEAIARAIMNDIRRLETYIGHTNTILIGDFNMNPFENGMVKPHSFNAVMAKEIAIRRIRTINETKENYQYFYNPMWSFFGDLSPYSPGTYIFRENSNRNDYVWNMFDQVLMRPEIIHRFANHTIEIIEKKEVGISVNFNKKTKMVNPSDHLPIKLALN